MKYKAILFDTRSIQRYIFSGSQLRTNIGASYLVERVFDDVLLPAVREVLGDAGLDADTWREETNPRWDAMETAARVGYIGGGNALLLFRADTEECVLRAVVTAFTKRLLVHAPGLQTGAAIGEIALAEDGSFAEDTSLTALVHALKDGQNTVFPLTNVPYTGLTLDCPACGETANAWDAEQLFYAWETERKLRAGRKAGGEDAPAEAELVKKLKSVLSAEEREDFLQDFVFPTEFSKLGQKTPKNDIAVVHIDGNNMGRKFQACDTLTKRKNMSLDIRRSTIAAFAALIRYITERVDCYAGALAIAEDVRGRRCLPVRPLVLGGDDMTFVCAAAPAIEFSQFLMRHLMDSGIASCGGITIMNTNYPFFRAYEMAEELCGAAKERMRECEAEQGIESCWLDYAILHGEQAPTLAQFRAEEYSGACGSLHFGPFRVDADAQERESLAALLDGVKAMRKLPTNKAKELRRVLHYGAHEQKQFLTQLLHLGQRDDTMRLPDIPAWKEYEQTLWCNGRTPYVNAIELMDYILADEEG